MYDFLNAIKWLVIFVLFAVVLIAASAAVVYGFGWIWNALPLGPAALSLGFAILAVTFYYSRNTPAAAADVSIPERLSALDIYQTLGILFGSFIVIAGFLWFFTPTPLLNALPGFSTGLWNCALGLLLLYGIGECVRLAVLSMRVYWLGSVFFFTVSGIVLWFLNLAIWRFTDSFPADYFVIGKVLVGVCVLLQIAYLAVFKALPAFAQRLEIEEQEQNVS